MPQPRKAQTVTAADQERHNAEIAPLLKPSTAKDPEARVAEEKRRAELHDAIKAAPAVLDELEVAIDRMGV